jgi:hypothetical protein
MVRKSLCAANATEPYRLIFATALTAAGVSNARKHAAPYAEMEHDIHPKAAGDNPEKKEVPL